MSDRTAYDVLRSNDCNTYVMSCHINQEALYKAMRQDLRIACAEIAKLRAEREAMKKTLVDISRWLLSRPMRSDAEELMLARCRAALAEKGE